MGMAVLVLLVVRMRMMDHLILGILMVNIGRKVNKRILFNNSNNSRVDGKKIGKSLSCWFVSFTPPTFLPPLTLCNVDVETNACYFFFFAFREKVVLVLSLRLGIRSMEEFMQVCSFFNLSPQ